MSKHTPGPWVAKEDGKYRDSPWSIDHEDGHDASWAPISTAKGRTLALVVNDDSKRPMDFQEEEMHANANLIAAAPDLLEALEWSIGLMTELIVKADAHGRSIEQIEKDGMLPAQFYRARNSIARARGEANES